MNTNFKNRIIMGGLTLFALFLSGCAEGARERKTENLAPDSPQMKKVLGHVSKLELDLRSPSIIVRRRAISELTEIGLPASAALERGLNNSDHVVRRGALRSVCELFPKKKKLYLAKAIKDPQPLVRLVAVEELAKIEPRDKETTNLLQAALKDKDPQVSQIAGQALWPFHRDNISIRDRLDYDHEVNIASSIRMPKIGWKFHLDPNNNGHLRKWYEIAFDDKKWDEIQIEQTWQKAGHEYVGTAWYRTWITSPAKPDHVAVEIRFNGVGENAWVWVNGIYIGEHAIGPKGWDESFTLDITEELKWGQKNQVTVRAMSTTNAGGIWRPVVIEVLK